ncbi:MAG TPA: serine/threonine-protein kinase, partial [Marmoricola sp.]|nr:serine/threonine-protein kinase [Marmoricola sp.]
MEFNTLAAPGTTYAAGVTVTGSFPRVGDYELLTQIGEGGMGVVHLARASDGRRVAVKVLRPQVIGDQEARQRLAREVNSLRLVRSPRVAEILDADPFGPTPFVVTRYVPGLSLYDHIREEGLLEGTDLWHFARLLAEALVSVHSVGVLHRDVKPSNVLMEGRSPVLIDFGLARLSEDPRLTHTGWLLGTPGYLAPELLYGDEATPAADVHAWAATVVFAATGRSPYGKGPTMAVLDRVRLGDYDLTGVPANLRDLIAAGLSTEPTDRPTMSAILASLSGAAPAAEPFTMPITARPRSTAGAAAVVLPGGAHRHQPGGLQLRPAMRQRMLDGLVLADRAVEHHALAGVLRGARQRRLAQAHGLGGDEDALGVHAVQDVLEAPAFLANAVLLGNLEVHEEQLVGVDALAAHLLDLAHRDALAVEAGVEQREPLRGRAHLVQRRGARQQQHQVGYLSGGDPHLLAVD